MKKHKLFFLALGIPVIVLLSMTVKPLQATYLGEDIRLQTAPVDPRDLFYGDYVILDFEIERVDLNQLDKDLVSKFAHESDGNIYYDGKERYLDVYIVLEEKNGIHHVDYVTENKPSSGLYIRGEMQTYLWDNELRINTPIERYFVEEGTGRQLEQDARQGRIVVDLKVYKGYPILKDIKVMVE